jgi:hypothetical protein
MPKHWVDVLGTNRVKIVIDCTELPIQGTANLQNARSLWSTYKNKYTGKWLVGVNASGVIVFVSFGYSGKATDYQITEICGVLELLEKGDLVLADRGFNILELLLQKECGLLVAHTHAHGEKEEMGGKYKEDQLLAMQRYSNLRIHVERAMDVIKRMGMLQKTIRLDCKHYIAHIMGISAMLANYGMPLLNKEDADRVITL